MSVAWAVRCLGWRSSSSPLGQSRKGRIRPSGSAMSSAASSDSSAARTVAEPIASRGVEQQCLDARPTVGQRRCGTIEHRRQRLGRAFGVVLFELHSRERDAHRGTVALVRAQVGELELRGFRVPHSHPHLECPATHVDLEHVLAGQQPFQVLRARELRHGFVEAALAKAQDAAGVVDHELGPGVGRRAETLLRAREMALRLREAPHPHERHAGHRERAGRHRLVGPAMLLGNRDRQLAQLERERQRLPAERRRDREVRQAADLDEGP